MVKFDDCDLLQTSKEVKEFIDGNKFFPEWITIDREMVNRANYLKMACECTINILAGKRLQVESGGYLNAPTPQENVKSGKIYKDEYKDIARRVLNFIQTKNIAPNYATSSLGKIGFLNLIYIFARILAFYKKEGYMPNYATVNPVNSDETVLNVIHDQQDDKCRCCPSTLYMIFRYYRIGVSEQDLATAMGTSDTKTAGKNCSGTPPSRIVLAVNYVNKRFKTNFKYKNLYLSDVGGINGLKDYIKKGIPVCLHVNESGFSWTNSQVGHYVPLVGVKPGYCRINDPYWVKGSEKWEADSNVVNAINLKSGFKSLHIIYR